MALTKEERDRLPAEHFAVPGKRELPIHDDRHARLAWDMVDRTHDLTPAERSGARSRILRRAKELGIDTSDWHTKASAEVHLHFVEAMALNIPTDAHPNKLPFSGVLTKVGVASDKAPEGTGGKRTLITRAAADAAIGSLLGMGIDYVEGLSGHDPQQKIGIITAADVAGDDIRIQGFFYAADFPALVNRIRAQKAKLGFSYEAQVTGVEDREADPWVITSLVFTGAAVLRKDKAAYQTTSLAATASTSMEGIEDMDDKELKAAIDAAVTAATAPLLAEMKKQTDVSAATHALVEKVRPHADALERVAEGMEAAGIGCHATRGHAMVARKMAAHMMASAHLGRTPDIYDDTGWLHSRAAAETNVNAGESEAIKKLTDSVASLTTVVTDLKAKVTAGVSALATDLPNPKRKTAPAHVQAAISKYGLEADEEGKISARVLSEALKKAGVHTGQQLKVVQQFTMAGMLTE